MARVQNGWMQPCAQWLERIWFSPIAERVNRVNYLNNSQKTEIACLFSAAYRQGGGGVLIFWLTPQIVPLNRSRLICMSIMTEMAKKSVMAIIVGDSESIPGPAYGRGAAAPARVAKSKNATRHAAKTRPARAARYSSVLM
jgi:hypothetical protein